MSDKNAPLTAQASTFGRALLAYAQRFQCHFVPATETDGRYFVLNAPGFIFDGGLYDPHIIRGQLELCPKQDLQFALCDGDILDLAGPLARYCRATESMLQDLVPARGRHQVYVSQQAALQ